MTVFKTWRLPSLAMTRRTKAQAAVSRKDSKESTVWNPMKDFESVLTAVVGLSIRQWRE